MNSGSVPRRKRGFTYAEMLLTTLLLSLCAGFFCDTISFGVGHLQRRTRYGHAVILLDTLSAAVRNDLQYATAYYDDNSFERVVRDCASRKDYAVRTWYGVGQWRTDNPDSYFDENLIQWREIHDGDAAPGQLIRKSALFGGQSFFDCLAPPESYADGDGFYAKMEMIPLLAGDKIDRFSVTVTLYDGPGETAKIIAQRADFVVVPVQRIPFRTSAA